MAQLEFDEDTARRLERFYAGRDARRRRALVRAALAAEPGEHLLDVGCGPGFYLTELLDTVGPDGRIVGVDQSGAMLAMASRRVAGDSRIELREGEALNLPADDDAFDAAFSVQVLEYVEDASAALTELHRVVRPGGRVVIWDVDWATVSWYSKDPARMTRVLAAWDEHLVHRSLPQTLASRMRHAGFIDVTGSAHVFAANDYDEETYAVGLLGVITDFVRGRASITSEEADAWLAEQRELGERGEFFFSCTQFCFTGRKPAG
jgi:ubiquinone/menaquinone biosynthesis C-methylase UbiE